MLTEEDCNKILEQHGEFFSKEEVAILRDFLYKNVHIAILQKDKDEQI